VLELRFAPHGQSFHRGAAGVKARDHTDCKSNSIPAFLFSSLNKKTEGQGGGLNELHELRSPRGIKMVLFFDRDIRFLFGDSPQLRAGGGVDPRTPPPREVKLRPQARSQAGAWERGFATRFARCPVRRRDEDERTRRLGLAVAGLCEAGWVVRKRPHRGRLQLACSSPAWKIPLAAIQCAQKILRRSLRSLLAFELRSQSADAFGTGSGCPAEAGAEILVSFWAF
jgi:hypothetical protein